MKSDDRLSIIQERRHIDLPGFNVDMVNRTAPDDMYPDDLILTIERNDPELLHRFGLEIEEILEEIVTDQRASDLKTFQIIPLAFGPDLFEGVANLAMEQPATKLGTK